MSAERPGLTITFEWDHASGYYEAVLANGARFIVNRSDIGGRLERNLDLFRAAVTRVPGSKKIDPETKSAVRQTIQTLADDYLASGGMVQRVGPAPKLSIDDLDLDL